MKISAKITRPHTWELVSARFLLFQQREVMPAIEIMIGLVTGPAKPEVAWERFLNFTEKSIGLQAITF